MPSIAPRRVLFALDRHGDAMTSMEIVQGVLEQYVRLSIELPKGQAVLKECLYILEALIDEGYVEKRKAGRDPGFYFVYSITPDGEDKVNAPVH